MAFLSNIEDDDALSELPIEAMLEEAIPIDEQTEIMIDPETGEVIEDTEMTMMSPTLADELGLLPFNSNLVKMLTKDEREEIGEDLCEKVQQDKESRAKWYDTLKKGMLALGIYAPDDDSGTGIQRVRHPLLIEAATQFQARAMAELLPPGGPVKTTTYGEMTDEVMQQARRVEGFMNYQLTVEDRTYYEERDQMLYLLPFTGSEFDKQYSDPVTGKVVSRWVRSDDFIAPYDTKSLETAKRYTHKITLTANEYRKQVAAGFYDDCLCDMLDSREGAEGFTYSSDDDEHESPMREVYTDLDGQEKPSGRLSGDKEFTFYEIHVDYDVPGFEEDVALPFIITIEAESKKILSVYRNWREDDDTKARRVWFTHKKFLPGFGFYGFGLLHCIGDLGEAASEILQILLDSGAYATLQGGFKSKDAKLPGDVVLTPGEWQDCEMTAEELAKAFYTPPFKEPSPVLVQMLGQITELGQRFAATTETMVGDAATTGPVGTMVAQIEQGSKVFSGIHKRLHKAFGDEFIHIAELNGETLPEMYPYTQVGNMQHVLRQDFDGRVDVIPVSDPNIFSSAQRIAMAQSVLQLAQAMPDISDRREAAIGLLTAMRFPEPEKVFPKRQDAQRLDPASELASVLLGRPIKAYPEQDHPSHNMIHQQQLQGLPPQYQPIMQAHVFEHEAMHQYNMLMQGVQPGMMPPPYWQAKPTEKVFAEMPPEVENQIAQMMAQALQQRMQQQQQAQQQAQMQQQQQQAAQKAAQKPQADPMAEEQRKDMAFQNEERRKQMAFEAEQQRKNAGLSQDVDREDALAGIEPTLVKQAGEFLNAAGLQMSPRELAMLSKALGRTFSETVQAISRMAMGGQGAGPAPIAEGMANAQRGRFM